MDERTSKGIYIYIHVTVWEREDPSEGDDHSREMEFSETVTFVGSPTAYNGGILQVGYAMVEFTCKGNDGRYLSHISTIGQC